MLSNATYLSGISFGLIKDLSKPDALLFGINLLPFVMTGINIINAFLTPTFSKKDLIQAIFIAILFLVLLYNAISALLIYWTMNNVIFFIRTLLTRSLAKEKKEKKLFPSTFKISFTIPENVWVIAKHYFALLFIFYVFQLISIPGNKVFHSFLDYLPFTLAACCFFVLQIRDLVKSFQPNIKHITSLILAIICIIVIIGLFASKFIITFSFNFPVNYLFTYSSIILGIFAFLIGIFVEGKANTDYTSPAQRLIFVLLGILIPALHFASVNTEYLMGYFYILYFLLLITCGLSIYFILSLSCCYNSNKTRAAVSTGIFLLLFIFLPTLRVMFKQNRTVDFDIWIILALFMLFSLFIKNEKNIKSVLNIGFILLIVFFCSFIYSIVRNPVKNIYPRKKLSNEMHSIHFKTTPNIYLFVYDGIPNSRVFQTQNLPFNPLQNLLNKYKFKLYMDTYTLGESSLISMAKLLDFTDKMKEGFSDTYSGNSYTNLILRNNGYSTFLLLTDYYVGTNAIYNRDLYYELFPPREIKYIQSDFFYTLIRGIFQSDMRFDTKGLLESEGFTETDIQLHKLELIKSNLNKAFVVNHYPYPCHTEHSGKYSSNDKENWIINLNIALEQMAKDFDAIEKYDPNSIVIAISDHGPYISEGCYNLSKLKREEITEDLIWDMIGTMVAIRWPDPVKAEKYDRHLKTNQDIFPVVFAYLMDDPMPLKFCPDDTFWGLDTPFRAKIGFDKGKIIR